MRRILEAVVLLALGCRTPEPASTAPAETKAASPASAPAPAPAESGPVPAPVESKPELSPASDPATAREPRACGPGERLDTGCTCSDGVACFDICCGADALCGHPAEPGGKSACILQASPPAAEKKPRACKDGDFLASGCRCGGTTCMDICCVGSACSHHASEDGGYAKCLRR
ncbi:hypothetical protein [Nannocystis punicea]|uniref:Dickkopf N-terminal cysteine-rich domain-containing protein n=1 Tax=Nannocystis punicea TaxID=2995304 RepID=A0ABY7H7Q8_9BACT|nr:hypothetical protein [Nannocystis poenicansa]WAS95307.1 hypothetical protein O0S08_04035 [Nannocystis poenicansa]